MLLVVVLALPIGVSAAAPDQPQTLSATVEFVRDQYEEEFLGSPQTVQVLELSLTSGPNRGDIIVVEYRVQELTGARPMSPGDLVYVREEPDPTGVLNYTLLTPSRWPALLGLGVALIAIVLAVGRGRGFAALLGLAFSFVIIFALLLPQLVAGRDPFWVALLAGALSMPPSYLLAHGPSRKTAVALAGSLLGLIVTGLLAVLAVSLTHLTGYASEEAGFLQALGRDQWDVRGLLLAGIMVGVLGVLDDITVAQAGTALAIHQANSTLNWRELYARTMRVGQDHIASMVNTLALVYAGASLPLLLLLRDTSAPLGYLLSQEAISEEIVRMLVTSCGLIATVPVTTALAAFVYTRRQGEDDQQPSQTE